MRDIAFEFRLNKSAPDAIGRVLNLAPSDMRKGRAARSPCNLVSPSSFDTKLLLHLIRDGTHVQNWNSSEPFRDWWQIRFVTCSQSLRGGTGLASPMHLPLA